MKRQWDRISFRGKLALGLLALSVYVALTRDAFMPSVVVVVFGGFGSTQLWQRRRWQAQRGTMAYGTGAWRAKVGRIQAARFFGGSALGTLLFDVLLLEVLVTHQEVTLTPTSASRRVGRFAPLRLSWVEIADVRVGDPVRTVAGRVNVTALTPVTLVLVGEHVSEFERPMTDEEALEEGFTPADRAEEDAETLAFMHEMHGPDHVFGTVPLTIFVDDASELIELLRRYRTGALPQVV